MAEYVRFDEKYVEGESVDAALDKAVFGVKRSNVVLVSPTGTGKTRAICLLLKQLFDGEPDAVVYILSTRRCWAEWIAAELGEDLGFVNYMEARGGGGCLVKETRVIISPQSYQRLCRMKHPNGDEAERCPALVVADEWGQLSETLVSPTMKGQVRSFWATFSAWMRSDKTSVFFSEGFFTDAHADLISVWDAPSTVLINERRVNKGVWSMIESDLMAAYNRMLDDLKKGYKIVVVANGKRVLENVKCILREHGFGVSIITGDSTSRVRSTAIADLSAVLDSVDVHCLGFNSTVGAGVSVGGEYVGSEELLPEHWPVRCYAIYDGAGCGIEGVLQMAYRFRTYRQVDAGAQYVLCVTTTKTPVDPRACSVDYIYEYINGLRPEYMASLEDLRSHYGPVELGRVLQEETNTWLIQRTRGDDRLARYVAILRASKNNAKADLIAHAKQLLTSYGQFISWDNGPHLYASVRSLVEHSDAKRLHALWQEQHLEDSNDAIAADAPTQLKAPLEKADDAPTGDSVVDERVRLLYDMCYLAGDLSAMPAQQEEQLVREVEIAEYMHGEAPAIIRHCLDSIPSVDAFARFSLLWAGTEAAVEFAAYGVSGGGMFETGPSALTTQIAIVGILNLMTRRKNWMEEGAVFSLRTAAERADAIQAHVLSLASTFRALGDDEAWNLPGCVVDLTYLENAGAYTLVLGMGQFMKTMRSFLKRVCKVTGLRVKGGMTIDAPLSGVRTTEYVFENLGLLSSLWKRTQDAPFDPFRPIIAGGGDDEA